MKGLTKALGRADASTILSSAAGSKGKDAAQRALLAFIVSLDAWAGPLKVHDFTFYHSLSTSFLPLQANIEGNFLAVSTIDHGFIGRIVGVFTRCTALDLIAWHIRVWLQSYLFLFRTLRNRCLPRRRLQMTSTCLYSRRPEE